jgi:cell division protein ZapA (FtsZ GTPase activity inhibitor)
MPDSTTPLDDTLRQLRPTVAAEEPTAATTPADELLHRALRPILKLHNERLLQLVADFARDYRLPLATAAPADQQRLLTELLRRNQRLQHTAVGLVTALLTAAEYAYYRRHRPEVHRRLLELLRQRVLTQTATVVALAAES